MAGQGVNMGFADVECLVQTLEKAVRDGADFSKNSLFLFCLDRYVEYSL